MAIIEGVIDEQKRGRLRLRVRGLFGSIEIDAFVDTGFNGGILLPISIHSGSVRTGFGRHCENSTRRWLRNGRLCLSRLGSNCGIARNADRSHRDFKRRAFDWHGIAGKLGRYSLFQLAATKSFRLNTFHKSSLRSGDNNGEFLS